MIIIIVFTQILNWVLGIFFSITPAPTHQKFVASYGNLIYSTKNLNERT